MFSQVEKISLICDCAHAHNVLSNIISHKQVRQLQLLSSSYDDVPNDLSFLAGMRKRINLKGNGPRAIAMIGNTAYVPEYFTDSMKMVSRLQELIFQKVR